METTKLKKFATEARAKLRAGVATKIRSLGFDADGRPMAGMEPNPMVGGCTWNGQILPSAFAEQWQALRHRIEVKGLKEVVEEGAYTWFNRLMAIRILSMNHIMEPALRFVDEARTPKILDDARQGRVMPMSEEQHQRLRKLFEDPTRMNEQFALLVVELCHHTPILQGCFGSMADYTELLIPGNILEQDGFIDMLNSATFISDDDYKSAELIGWLYQFYISDRKDEVFAKKGKVEADEIPAATQIFTPNWIVKYMVQNAVLPQVRAKRLPEEDKKYLIDTETPEEPKKPRDLKVADLACGSGHILNECFDLLYDLYVASGYGRGDAIESIFANNLLGIDIDERARQLSTFALMLKACQRDDSFADAHILPKVLGMPEPLDSQYSGPLSGWFHHFFKGDETPEQVKEMEDCFELMRDAQSLGSIMKFEISPSTRFLIEKTVEFWDGESEEPKPITDFLPYFRIILALTDKYDAIVMNPPYMASSRFDEKLSLYVSGGGKGDKKVKAHYIDSKADLFSIFMDVAIERLRDGGRYGMINMHSWMFLSSFERLRNHILKEQTIVSMLHLGARTFDELSGEVIQNAAFIIEKRIPSDNTAGHYYRLVDGRNCSEKEATFIESLQEPKQGVSFANIAQANFTNLPGSPIGYWVSSQMIRAFSNKKIKDRYDLSNCIQPGDSELFLRLWYEISKQNIKNGWKFVSKGGSFRKWYGNIEYVLNYGDNGEPLLEHPNTTLRTPEKYFQEGFVWSRITTKAIALRFWAADNLVTDAGPIIYCRDKYYLGLLNSAVAREILFFISPTINYQVGNVGNIPIIEKSTEQVRETVNDNINVSAQDWDAHETSWDFQRSELIGIDADKAMEIVNDFCDVTGICIDMAAPEPDKLEWILGMYKMKWEAKFQRLHNNEEELNRQFIDNYGLQDELAPDVPLDEVTILQQGEISFKDGEMEWHDDVVIKQLISYVVGVWMGRYRLDRPGLNIAHPDPTPEEMAPNKINGEELDIDDDAIIPILPVKAPFYDNLANYVKEFVRIVWGENTQTENLNFIEKCLGKKIEDYLQKDFWKDHKKMYQNRPIYWLFSSKKGAFKAIVYVHRMHPYTVEQVRTRYLLKYIDWLRSEALSLEVREADLTTAERRELDKLRTAIDESLEYHERLQVIAEQAIPIDLDNGILHNHALFGDILTKLK